MGRKTWTKEEEAFLEELWKSNKYSATEIAAEFFKKLGKDLTRCAILGKIHRMGLSKEKLIMINKLAPHKEDEKRISLDPSKEDEKPISLGDLGPKQCRWMYEVNRACGEPVFENKSFCEKHCKEAFSS